MARWFVIALALAACSRASKEADTKNLQDQPPPKDVVVPAGLSIAVDLDGTAQAPITGERLKTTKPDFADVDRRAWLITTLIPEAAPAGSVIEAAAPTGVAVKFAHPTAAGLEPVLFLTRRGEVIVSAIDPKDPFPRYHGQGGRLHRPGDSVPRVVAVARLAITRPTQ